MSRFFLFAYDCVHKIGDIPIFKRTFDVNFVSDFVITDKYKCHMFNVRHGE